MASSCLLVATHLCNGHVYYTVCCHGDSSVEGHKVQVPQQHSHNLHCMLATANISLVFQNMSIVVVKDMCSFMSYTQPFDGTCGAA